MQREPWLSLWQLCAPTSGMKLFLLPTRGTDLKAQHVQVKQPLKDTFTRVWSLQAVAL